MNNALPYSQLFVIDGITNRYKDIIYYLTTQKVPVEFTTVKKRTLIEHNASFTMIGFVLYKLSKDKVLRRCIFDSEVNSILEGCHSDV